MSPIKRNQLYVHGFRKGYYLGADVLRLVVVADMKGKGLCCAILVIDADYIWEIY